MKTNTIQWVAWIVALTATGCMLAIWIVGAAFGGEGNKLGLPNSAVGGIWRVVIVGLAFTPVILVIAAHLLRWNMGSTLLVFVLVAVLYAAMLSVEESVSSTYFLNAPEMERITKVLDSLDDQTEMFEKDHPGLIHAMLPIFSPEGMARREYEAGESALASFRDAKLISFKVRGPDETTIIAGRPEKDAYGSVASSGVFYLDGADQRRFRRYHILHKYLYYELLRIEPK